MSFLFSGMVHERIMLARFSEHGNGVANFVIIFRYPLGDQLQTQLPQVECFGFKDRVEQASQTVRASRNQNGAASHLRTTARRMVDFAAEVRPPCEVNNTTARQYGRTSINGIGVDMLEEAWRDI